MTDERRLRTRDELLAQVQEDGTARRRRRLAATSGSVLAAIAAVAVAVAGLTGTPHRDRVTANEPNRAGTSTTIAESTTTTDGAVTSTTTDMCRNSYDNRVCATRYGNQTIWDPPVKNRPGTLTASQLPRQPGDDPGLVRIRVTYSDPDSGPFRCGAAIDPDNVTSDNPQVTANAECNLHGPLQLITGQSCQGFYGHWDAPPPHGSSGTLEWDLTHETPGPHQVWVQMELSQNRSAAPGITPICDPYSELLNTTINIVVPAADGGAPQTSTSTTTTPTTLPTTITST